MFTAEVLEKIPTARDPWQIANMTPGVSLSGYNVGGSQSGQQLTPSVRGSTASVQWNLEGGSITDLSSNSSSIYFNFDSFDQIQVTTGGGDVSVQSSGLAINLVTKSGSNVFKGTFNATYENDATQGQNVTKELFDSGAGGFLSGNPLQKIARLLDRGRRPDREGQAVVLGVVRQAGHQRRHHQLLRRQQGGALQRPGHRAEERAPLAARSPTTTSMTSPSA